MLPCGTAIRVCKFDLTSVHEIIYVCREPTDGSTAQSSTASMKFLLTQPFTKRMADALLSRC